MKLTDYLRSKLHKEHPLLRLNKPFIEPTPQELEKILRFIDYKEFMMDSLNPLERLGMDLILGSVGVDSDNKEQVKSLLEYLDKN